MKAHVDLEAVSSAPSPVRLPTKWPHVISEGDSKVTIYKTQTVTRGKKYRTFTLSYFANGKRQRQQFADFVETRRAAVRIAEQKAQGALGAAALSANERMALQAALTLLARHEGTNKSTPSRLVEIVQDYAAACAVLPVGSTLAEAVKFFAQRHPANMQRMSVAEVVEEFIADRRSAGCSPVHLRDMDVRLRRQFALAFSLPINSVSAPHVQQWVYGLKNQKTGQVAKPRTKDNMLRQVVSLFNFARRMKYVTTDLALEIAEIPGPKPEHAAIGIYEPGEIIRVLAATDAELTPALAIAVFGGLRLAEVSRLDWRDVRLDERAIVVQAEHAKTAARRIVPISDNLAAWLLSCRKPFGPVNPCMEELGSIGHALGNRFERAAARAKVAWKRNGFRHSYITYRVATLKDVAAVALECGNSPAVIFSNYRALATEAEGKAWFAVMPPEQSAKIISVAAAIAAA